jgi:hypothetical protein
MLDMYDIYIIIKLCFKFFNEIIILYSVIMLILHMLKTWVAYVIIS